MTHPIFPLQLHFPNGTPVRRVASTPTSHWVSPAKNLLAG